MFRKKPKKQASDSANVEKRYIPSFIPDLDNPDIDCVMGNVLMGKSQGSEHRVYYAAYYNKNSGIYSRGQWQILAINYCVSSIDGAIYETYNWVKDHSLSFDGAVRRIIEFERDAERTLNMKPVPGTESNYFTIAYSHGSYFDKNKNYHSIENNPLIQSEASFTQKSIAIMYNSAKAAKERSVIYSDINSWDEFYKKIVNPKPIELRPFQPEPYLKHGYIKYEWLAKRINDESQKIKNYQKRLLDDKESTKDKKDILTSMRYHQAFYGEDIIYDTGQHYRVFIFTSLLQTGAEMYKRLTTSPVITQKQIEELRAVKSTISYYAEKHFNFSKAQAEVLPELIMQGTDPNKRKYLPFQTLEKTMKDLKNQAQKKAATADQTAKKSPKPPKNGL